MPNVGYETTLSKEIQEIALKELNEDPARRHEDIQAIRDWLKKQPHLQAVPTDDRTILRFLRGCKFSLERTKEKMDMFYTLKSTVPELFGNRDPRQQILQELLEIGTYLPIPNIYDDRGRKIIIIRGHAWNPSRHKLEEVFKLSNMIMDILLEEDEQLQVTGMIQILDLQGGSMGHLTHFTPATIKKAVTTWQDGYPTRPKAMHFIHLPHFFETVFLIFNSFAKEKMKERNHIHTRNLDGLHEHISKDLLPVEYGGTNGTLQEYAKYWRQKVENRRQWFLDDAAVKSNERKRPGKPKTCEDFLGMEGSFRRLAVD